ncbi:MAG: hemerythrin domain-containing protein [Bacteroidales bacterium]|jgi:regulator of cell morphogenesis and NO signaling|nr:hemerythrin domain-containing protein [Bacteroidales bacterium]
MKLAELICQHPDVLSLLPRFGIELGFGEKTVEEVCTQYQVSYSLFNMICNIYIDEYYFPDIEKITIENMDGLLPYLVACHQFYFSERIPHIEKHLKIIASHCETKLKTVLLNFYDQYRDELEKHFKYEEEIVFPYIKNLLHHTKKGSYSIHKYEQNHENIEDTLSDLTNIIIKYLPTSIVPQEKMSILNDIFHLAADINRHTWIENKLLIPYVSFLEKQ